jgi:hypothetical protein
MQARLSLALVLSSLLLAACGGSSNSSRAVPNPPPTNQPGTPVTGVLTARFDPSAAVVPFPTNLLLSGTTDLTLNIPVANPNDFSNPQVALNALDGWGTVTPWSTTFNAAPNPTTVVHGQTVRLFEVSLTGPGGGVTGIVRELTPGAEFVATMASATNLVIVPTRPLKQLTSYMAVLTNGIRDARGNDATPDQAYFLAKRTSPLCVNGQSTDPLLPSATACALEPLRQLTNSQEAAAAAAGIPRNNIVLSWVATTQSITPVLQAVRSQVQPSPMVAVNTGMNTSIVPGLLPTADIYVGTIDLPYYLLPPSAQNPTGPLNGFWKAAPGAYVPPFNQIPLNPTSTNITFANPFPVANATVRVPVLITVPNANSGQTRPASGWKVAIYQHGITSARSTLLAAASTLALQGFVGVAIDLPLHGLPPGHPFHAGNFPALGATERTFNVDYINNQTGAPGPDGVVDDSGAHFINLGSLLTSRDNIRQAVSDLFVLAASVPFLDLDNNGSPDVDSAHMSFVGISLGAMVGTSFLALEPTVNHGLLSVPGGGIAQLLNGSPTFGPRIRAGLAAAGVQAGTPEFDQFLGATQIVVDSADPINYGFASAQNAILFHEVVGDGAGNLPDQVVPNTVAGAPLSGSTPLRAVLGLSRIAATTQNANGVRGFVQFTAGGHTSLLDPGPSLAVTVEMQTQMAGFVASRGTAVIVSDTSVIRTQ